jgi:hypothetical protein
MAAAMLERAGELLRERASAIKATAEIEDHGRKLLP